MRLSRTYKPGGSVADKSSGQQNLPKPAGGQLTAGAPQEVEKGGAVAELTEVVLHGSAPGQVTPPKGPALDRQPFALTRHIMSYLGSRDTAQLIKVSRYFGQLLESDPKLKESLALLQAAYGVMGLHSTTLERHQDELLALQDDAALRRANSERREDLPPRVFGALACVSCFGAVASGLYAALQAGLQAPPDRPQLTNSSEMNAQTLANFEIADTAYYDELYSALYAMGGFAAGFVVCCAATILHVMCTRTADDASRAVQEKQRQISVAENQRGQAADQTASLVFHLGAGGTAAQKPVMGGASTQQRSEVLERPALSSGVRELLAAPESVLTREDKLRFLNLWKSCRWSSDAMVTFLKEVLDSSKLTSEEKRRVCVEGVAESAHTADELAMMELALDMALNRLAPAKAAALRTDLGRG